MPETQTFAYTGAVQEWVVPTWVTEVTIECWGAQGGTLGAFAGSIGFAGRGGYATGTLAVTPGETLYLYVGGTSETQTGGWNGGGRGYGYYGGGGGTDVRYGGTTLADRVIVAGAGGGGGPNSNYKGGDGGGLSGADGLSPYGDQGRGGTQTAGGSRGGALGVGGDGDPLSNIASGGGGGYYGGGGSGFDGGGGGGGSSYIGGVTAGSTTAGQRVGHGQITLTWEITNQPPNAPLLIAPADGSVVDVAGTQRFDWDFSDPDPGDSQSAYNLRYRAVGAATWVETGWVATPNSYHDVTGAAFTAGTAYEWQVATKDALGVEGPFSGSWFFTAVAEPDAPTWMDPLNGQTLTADSYAGVISAPDVAESEWRLVADNAGSIDESTILQGPVRKTVGDLRTHTFSGLANNTPIWWQARVKFNGLWSKWASVRTPVSFTPPPAPTFVLTPADDPPTILVDITNPTPGPSEPPVTHNEIYVTDPGKSEERRADAVPPNGSWLYRTPAGDQAGGVDYSGRIRVVAHGDNGTSASS